MNKTTPNLTPSSIQELVNSIALHMDGTNRYERFKTLYENDRIAFVYDCIPTLGATLAPYQEEILGYYDDGQSRVAIRGPHGLGKSTLASILVNHAVLTATTDTKVPTTASAWRQLEKFLWPEIHKTAKLLDWSRIGRQPYTSSELLVRSLRTDNAEAFAIASDDETSLEGAHATNILIIFDEAKTIPVPTWDALEGAFSSEGLSVGHKAQAFAISTPGEPSGRFHDIHQQTAGYRDWKVRHVRIQEAIAAGRVSAKWARQRKIQWGEHSAVYQNRVLGEFADNSESGMIPLSWINAAVERYENWVYAGRPPCPQLDHNDIALGCDVARLGNDSTVVSERHGLTLLKIHPYSKLTTTSTAGHVKLHLQDANKGYIEGDHLGASVYDILREQGVRNLYILIPGGATTFRDKSGKLEFLNNRSAMWWNMREMLDPAYGYEVMLPNHPRLIGDLSTPTYDVTSRGVIQLESARNIVDRTGFSPDYGTACCLAFWSWKRNKGGGVVF